MADLPGHEPDLGPFTTSDLGVHDEPIFAFKMVRNPHNSSGTATNLVVTVSHA